MSPRKPSESGGAQAARRAREALELTQVEFAALLGVPQSTVGRWEAGMRHPGAIGLALFALIEDSPTRARRVLRGREG